MTGSAFSSNGIVGLDAGSGYKDVPDQANPGEDNLPSKSQLVGAGKDKGAEARRRQHARQLWGSLAVMAL